MGPIVHDLIEMDNIKSLDGHWQKETRTSMNVSNWNLYLIWKVPCIEAGSEKLVYRLFVLFLPTEIFSKRRKIYTWIEEKPELHEIRRPNYAHVCCHHRKWCFQLQSFFILVLWVFNLRRFPPNPIQWTQFSHGYKYWIRRTMHYPGNTCTIADFIHPGTCCLHLVRI